MPTYAKVQYKGVYPGIDLVFYGNQGQLEYDFAVAPGADPSAIKLRIVEDAPYGLSASRERHRGASIAVSSNGDLVLRESDGDIRFHKPSIRT